MNLPENIKDQIEDSIQSGVCCKFVRIDDNWGIKAFLNEDDRDRSQNNQLEYAEYGLAPPCECNRFEVGPYYCFVTRVAEILACPSVYRKERDEWDKIGKKNQKYIDNWQTMANDAGLPEVFDDHVGNFGWYEGDFVLIDCGND